MQRSVIILISAITLLAAVTGAAAAQGRFVGGRTAVTNVRSNKEVQELGRYCVEEYNRSSHLVTSSDGSPAPLRFVEVVEAQRQVVAGIKYYLTVETVQGGDRRVFDAQVVVKPWMQSKQLLSFAPSTKFV